MMAVADNTEAGKNPDGVRVMIVDDSAVIRGFLTRFLDEDKDIKVISSVANGEIAVNSMERAKPDVIILDIEMPVMDGLTALPLLLKADPDVEVIIASTLTQANAAITLKAMSMGAAECLPKPTSREMTDATQFKQSLIQKTKTLGQVSRRAKKRKGLLKDITATTTATSQSSTASVAPKPDIKLRPEPTALLRPDVIAIGSSTGGPQALLKIFDALKTSIPQPIFITQHMPPTFTSILAEHIAKQSGAVCAEGKDGEPVEAGRIYLAPGDYHMTVQDNNGARVIRLNQDPPENFCRPAVDPMLRSLAKVYGKKVLSIILTGMGQDGCKGAEEIVAAGGTVLAQDESSSIVWGMPGSVARAGLCTKIVSLAEMPDLIRRFAKAGQEKQG